jgi:hypothetical protein
MAIPDVDMQGSDSDNVLSDFLGPNILEGEVYDL